MKGNSEGADQAAGKNGSFLRAAGVIGVAQNDDLVGSGLCEENITIGSDRKQTRALEIFREHVYLESLGDSWQESRGSLRLVGTVASGFGGKRRRQVGFLAMGHLRRA